jgi:hypothetical protein
MSEQLSTAIRELIDDAAERVTPVDAMQRGRRHRRRRHRAVLLAGVATVLGVVAITALAWPREEQSLHTIGRDGRFPRGWDFHAYMARERAMAKRSAKRIVDSIFLDLKFAIEDLSLPTCYVRLAQRTLDR